MVGVTGRKRHGKDSVAKVLVDTGLYKQVSFAEPLYQAVAKILNVPVEWVYAHKDEQIKWLKGSPTVRSLLQTMGTEWGRDMIDPDLWIKLCTNKIDRYHYEHYSVVVSDVRFINEAVALINKYGRRCRIWGVIKPDVKSTDTSGHSSEQEIDKIITDSIIHNNGTLEDLKNKVLHTLGES